MFAKAPPPRKKDPGPKKVEKPAVEDETSPGKENRMNEAVEEEEEEAQVEVKEAKGKQKKRGAAARAESKPKRKRIQVGPRGEMICKIVHNKPAVLIFFPSQYSRNRS